MAKKTTKTGKELERQVADDYRAMGARKVEHDVELAGHQIDVYVEMETADRALHRIAVEAKEYSKPVGIKIVADFAAVMDTLHRLKLVDEGVIVSAAGFSRQARNAAKEHGLRLLEPADLEAMPGGSGAGADARVASAEAAAPLPGDRAPLGRGLGSPFVVGRPLRASEPIFGRGEAFRFVAGELAKFSSVNIVGERRMGKTSLLNHLIGRQDEHLVPQPDQPPLVLACLDLQAGVSNEARFYGTALRELLDHLP
ncbi:MAG: restriction endonuclease, partial [Planctomycetota bacterium]